MIDGNHGNITIDPNGNGEIKLDADIIRVGDAGQAATISSNGTGNLTLQTGSGTSGTITMADGNNGNITLTPHNNGDVVLAADTVTVGDAGQDATISSNGTGNLTLQTGGTSGAITMIDGNHGNITIAPNGNGKVSITSNIVIADQKDIELGVNGTKIGTHATNQKLGFFDATPVAQRANANQVALDTATNTVGTPIANKVLVAVTSTSGGDQKEPIMNNFATLAASINEIRTVLVDLGLMKGQA